MLNKAIVYSLLIFATICFATFSFGQNNSRKDIKQLRSITIPKPDIKSDKAVILTREDFEKLWKRVNKEPIPELPAVDFEKEMVIFVSRGITQSHLDVDLTSVFEKDGVLYVSYKYSSGGVQNKELKSVYEMFVYEKSNLEVKWCMTQVCYPAARKIK